MASLSVSMSSPRWQAFRNMAAPQVLTPVQAVAVAALSDETHVAGRTAALRRQPAAAERILGSRWVAYAARRFFRGSLTSPNTAVAWRPCGCGSARPGCTIPGGYLSGSASTAINPGANAGCGIAMVELLALTSRTPRPHRRNSADHQ